jgi:hypothetical protein
MSFKEMTASDAMGLAQRAVLDIWLFSGLMSPDQGEAALLKVIERVESSARGMLAWCRVKRDELSTTQRKNKKGKI